MEQKILLITSQRECMEPLLAVMSTILQHSPMISPPEQVIGSLEEHNADLVVVDIRYGHESMPLIENLKRNYPMVQVIALVPYGDISLIERALASGADDYIAQPISLERLKTTLRNAFRLRNVLMRANGDNGITQAERPAFAFSIFYGKLGKLRTLREIEDIVIEHAISSCSGCITRAARSLGIGRSTLYRKMQEKHAVDAPILYSDSPSDYSMVMKEKA